MRRTLRFGAHEVDEGRFAGGLHVATRQYQRFFGELTYLHSYLYSRMLPTEPEEVLMFGILTTLQNLLEHECETLIQYCATQQGNANDQQFAARFEDGYVSFRSKYDWLLARDLITQEQWSTMDEIRRLRNDYVHARPRGGRRRYNYRGFPLLSQRSIRCMFVEVELALRAMRARSGRRLKWATIPPGYASEMRWPAEYVQVLEAE
jgi:hypothetical protein